ncbi:MAG: sugar ABC transporter substrate-binding protein [Casimicrobiaceae bacterium]
MKLAVFTKNLTNPAYEAARLGADRAARALGAQAVHYVPQKGDDPEEQSALIDRALAEAPDAFVFTPVHATRVNAAIGRIAAAGIPITGFVNPLPPGSDARCVTYVGSDDASLGQEIARYLFRTLDGRGSIVVVSGPADSVTSIARVEAFREAAAAHPGIVVMGTVMGDYRRDVARDRVAAWLRANDEPVNAFLVANDIMAIGVIDALHSAGRRAAVVGVNAIPEAIAAIRRGDMLATADFNAMRMAFLATECAIRHLRGEHVPETIELPVEIVDRNNGALWDLPYEQRHIPTLEETLACNPGS